MNYQEKQNAKKERYLELAEKNKQLSTEKWESASRVLENIPFGQPILVGHHSEKGHRSLINKSHNKLRSSIEIGKKADYYANKAESVGKAGISSDDPEAIEKLKIKLAKLEDLQTDFKEKNAEAKALKLEKPHPTWQLSNNNALIRNTKQRIEQLTKQASIQPKEDIIGAGYVVKEDIEDNRIKFIFEGKPEENVRTILKSYGFRWSPYNKAWQRMLNQNGRYAAKQIINLLT
jgi:hypothetical protein